MLSSAYSLASIDDQMGSMFNVMSSTTAATSGTTASGRGYIGFGGLSVKADQSNINLVSWQPPSWEAGCGGINLQGGALSFVKKDQIITFLRNIASSAPGYAFDLAMKTLCGGCMAAMETLAKKMQAMNKYLGNSCQMSKGIITDPVGAWDDVKKTYEDTKAAAVGVYDSYTAFSKDPETGADSVAEAKENDTNNDPCMFDSNLLWCRMKSDDFESWFVNGGDQMLLREIFSIFGSMIEKPNTDYFIGPDVVGDATIHVLPAPILKLEHLLEGGDLRLYKCDDYEAKGCINPSIETVNVEGFHTRIRNLLLGEEAATDGIVYKYSTNTGQLSVQQENLMANLPLSMGAMIRRLSVKSRIFAEQFVERGSKRIARDFLFQLIESIYSDLEALDITRNLPEGKAWQDNFRITVQDIREQKESLRQSQGETRELLEEYIVYVDSITHRVDYAPTAIINLKK